MGNLCYPKYACLLTLVSVGVCNIVFFNLVDSFVFIFEYFKFVLFAVFYKPQYVNVTLSTGTHTHAHTDTVK